MTVTVTSPTQDTLLGTLPPHTDVIAASLESGRSRLSQVDEFVQNQSQFDRQARLNLQQRVVEVALDMYLDYVSSQVMPWTGAEIDALKQIVQDMSAKFALLDLALPDSIFLVKTSGQEEAFAAYTRQLDVIALPANMVASLETTPNFGDPLHPAQSLTYLENTLIHECFHLFSKNNPERRHRLYSLIHYRSTGAPVELPTIPWPGPGSPTTMRDSKITNPDAPMLDVYIEMEVNEEPGGHGAATITRPLLPVLLADGAYRGGIFFEYLEWYFVAIEQGSSGHWQPIMRSDGRPIMYLMSPRNQQLWNQYLQLVGNNVSGELFHPDEVLAQNFVFVATLPTLDLLTNMGGILRQG